MPNLLLTNLPHNASDREIREWLESRDILIKSMRIIRDQVSSTSPAFGHVEVKDSIELQQAIHILDGKKLRNQTVRAKAVSAASPPPADLPIEVLYMKRASAGR